MGTDVRTFEVEELDSPIQRVVRRQTLFHRAPQVAIAIAALVVGWEIVRQNLSAGTVTSWPWRLKLLDLESGATVLTVFLVIAYTRMQYAETVRPIIGWTFTVPPLGVILPLPISRDRPDLLAVNMFNSGGGRAVVISVDYRFALLSEQVPSDWVRHDRFLHILAQRGLQEGKDFHFAHMRAGLPLMPGQSEMDKGSFVALVTRAMMRRCRVMDIRIRFHDSLGDVHERILPCRYVISAAL
jgi:hypothetical protein